MVAVEFDPLDEFGGDQFFLVKNRMRKKDPGGSFGKIVY